MRPQHGAHSDPGLLSHPVCLSTRLCGPPRTSMRHPGDVVINTTPSQPHLHVLSWGNCSSRLIIDDNASLKGIWLLFQVNIITWYKDAFSLLCKCLFVRLFVFFYGIYRTNLKKSSLLIFVYLTLPFFLKVHPLSENKQNNTILIFTDTVSG